jgi:hypothetical protein
MGRIVILIFLVCVFFVQAQTPPVPPGTNDTIFECEDLEWEERDEWFTTSRFNQEPIVYTVPMTFIIIRRDDGTTSLDEEEAFNAINIFNESSPFAKLQLVDVRYIDNTDYYTYNDTFGERAEFFEQYGNYNTLNTIFAGTVISPGSGNSVCGYAYYPSSNPELRVALVRNSCANTNNSSTTVHEWGHNFNLRHTHHNGNELVDGSNCSFAGDGICDTGAEPVLSTGNVNSNCEYVGALSVTDDAGIPYIQAEELGFLGPNPKNFMAYSRKICRDEFTLKQQERQQGAAEFYCQTMDCNIDIPNNLPTCETSINNDVISLKLEVAWEDDDDETGMSYQMNTPISLLMSATFDEPVASDGIGTEVFFTLEEDEEFPKFEDFGCFTFTINNANIQIENLSYKITYNNDILIYENNNVGESETISFSIFNEQITNQLLSLDNPIYLENDLRVYANPIINNELKIIGSFDVYYIYDLTGKKLITSSSNVQNISNLEKGIYFLQILKENTVHIIKVII